MPRATTTLVLPKPTHPLISPSGRGAIRLFADPQKRVLLYSIESGRVYQQGQPILFFDGKRVHEGPNLTGEILFTAENNRVFSGANAAAAVAYTIQNNRIFKGNEREPIIYSIEGNRVLRGPNPSGDIVFQANVDLVGDVQLLLPILADEAFRPQ